MSINQVAQKETQQWLIIQTWIGKSEVKNNSKDVCKKSTAREPAKSEMEWIGVINIGSTHGILHASLLVSLKKK